MSFSFLAFSRECRTGGRASEAAFLGRARKRGVNGDLCIFRSAIASISLLVAISKAAILHPQISFRSRHHRGLAA